MSSGDYQIINIDQYLPLSCNLHGITTKLNNNVGNLYPSLSHLGDVATPKAFFEVKKTLWCSIVLTKFLKYF